jgi:hypothetical protein
MCKYTETTSSAGATIIMRVDNEGNISSIPADPANSDYQAYLKSLDEASTL